jgi:hypothetical protein
MKVIVGIIGAAGMIIFPAPASGAHLKYVASHGSHRIVPNDTSYGASQKVKKVKKSRVYASTMKMTVTAYCRPVPGRGRNARKIFRQAVKLNGRRMLTSFGEKPRRGIVAADPRLFDRKTVFCIPGYG